MAHEHAEKLGAPDAISPPESLANLAQEAANTDREIPDNFGEKLEDLVNLFEKLPEYTDKERIEIIQKIKADQELRDSIGYSQVEFEESIDQISSLTFEQLKSFKAIATIVRTAEKPTEAIKNFIKNPGKFIALLQTLEISARAVVSVANKEHINHIPEEQRDFFTKIAAKATDFYKIIGFVNIKAAETFIKFMEANGLSRGETIDPKAFNSKRWSAKELKITYAIIEEMIDLKVSQKKVHRLQQDEKGQINSDLRDAA